MNERDIFRDCVPFEFRRASKRSLCFDNDPNAPKLVVEALAKRLRVEGCPKFAETVDIALKGVLGANSDRVRNQIYSELDSISDEAMCSETDRVIAFAKHIVAFPEQVLSADGGFAEVNYLMKRIGAELLSGLGDNLICPAGAISKVHVELGIPLHVLHRRRTEVKGRVSKLPELIEIVETLLVNRSGQISRIPRFLKKRVSQQELLDETLGG